MLDYEKWMDGKPNFNKYRVTGGKLGRLVECDESENLAFIEDFNKEYGTNFTNRDDCTNHLLAIGEMF